MGSRIPNMEESEPTGCPRRSKSAPGALKAAREAGGRPSPGLHIVATPIGNLRDVTLRALDTLAGADLIACEDTRVTRKLLAAYGIATPMAAYHEHNADRARPRLLERLTTGGCVALVSDAGSPLVSDPGYKLVRAAIAAGLPVRVVPGPSASLAALALSGLPTFRFLFTGFLPAKRAQRRRRLIELRSLRATLLVFETAPRLAALLADMAQILGPRDAALCRELTKLHEEVRRGTLAELAAHYRESGPPKGEMVIVVGPPTDPETLDDAAVDSLLDEMLAHASLRDAAARVAAATGRPRREIYARALGRAKMRGTRR